MDKRIAILIASLFVCLIAHAQTPVGFNYQGVARNADGSPQTDQQISLQISILDGESGVSAYSEIHDTNTNEFGLFTVVIGSNPINGSLSDVDWSSGDKWIQIELDPTGGSNYQLVGSQQLFSVPYAMYAAKAGEGVNAGDGLQIDNGVLTNTAPDQEVKMLGSGTITVSGTYPEFIISGTSANQDLANVLDVGADAGAKNITNLADPLESQDAATKAYVDNVNVEDADSDPVNEIQDLQLNGNLLSLTLNGNPTVIDLAPFLVNTDNQQLTLAEAGTLKTIGITGGNQVALDVDDGDSNPTNEIQDLGSTTSGNNRTVTITSGTSTTFSIADNDNSTSNEIQNLSSSASGNNRTIGISGGTATTINVADNDNNSTNEIQNLSSTTSGTDRTIAISGGGGTTINVADNDNSTVNEIQNLSSSASGNNRTIGITGGTGTTISVADNDSNSTNEIQNLSSTISGTDRTIAISGGSGTTISVADNDNSAVNEIQNLSSSASGTDRTINISGGTGTLINVADNDNSTNNELQDLSLSGNTLSLSSSGSPVDLSGFVLDQNNDAGGSRLINVGDPVSAQDVVTRNYLDIKDATDYAFKVPLAATATGADITFDLSGFDFDDGGIISGTQIIITENGAYNFVVKGSSNNFPPASLNLVINSANNPVTVFISSYSESFIFRLSAGDIVELEAVGTTAGEIFTLEFFGFKI